MVLEKEEYRRIEIKYYLKGVRYIKENKNKKK